MGVSQRASQHQNRAENRFLATHLLWLSKWQCPAFLRRITGDFTFTVKTTFDSNIQFDQCGVIIYQNSDNWFKASIEYENKQIARLGSVVTNLGYSDWATTDISAEVRTMWYRLSRRGSDFLIENSEDGEEFSQMRIFHLHQPLPEVHFGVYACSPLESSFEAGFTNFYLTESTWQAHPLWFLYWNGCRIWNKIV